MKRLIAILLVLVCCLALTTISLADDMDDLKAADNKMGKLYRSTDPTDTEAYINGFAEEFIWIHPAIAFPLVMTKEQLKAFDDIKEIEKQILDDNFYRFRYDSNFDVEPTMLIYIVKQLNEIKELLTKICENTK